MAIFGRNRSVASSSRSQDRVANLGWTAFRHSKDPNKQVVLDYMAQYGIELVKSKSGLFYISNLNSYDFDTFQRMTNYRAKIASVGVVGVQMNNGNIKSTFTSLEEAYRGLKVLYDSMRYTQGEDEF